MIIHILRNICTLSHDVLADFSCIYTREYTTTKIPHKISVFTDIFPEMYSHNDVVRYILTTPIKYIIDSLISYIEVHEFINRESILYYFDFLGVCRVFIDRIVYNKLSYTTTSLFY